MRRIFTTLVLCLIMIGSAFADTYRVTAHSTLNVRTAPSTKSKIVARLTSGQKVEVLSIQGKWAKISINGKTGYVSVQFLAKVNEIAKPVKPIVESQAQTVLSEVESEERPTSETTSVSQNSTKDEDSNLLFDCNSVSISDISLYLAGQVSVGWSNFLWNDGDCNGDIAYGVDAVLQLDFNNRVAFIPRNWYSELSIGYKKLGAVDMEMNYVDINLLPIGYKMPISNFSLKGKVGATFSMPLNGIETDENDFKGAFQVGVTGGLQLEYKQFGIGVNVEYDFMNALKGLEVNKLNNLAVMGTVVYRFGKF